MNDFVSTIMSRYIIRREIMERSSEKIECINRVGIRSAVMTTVSGMNIKEIPDIIDTVVKAGVNVKAVEDGTIYGGCNCGNCHLTIVPTGDIFACRRVQNSKVGNVFEDRLADVWVCEMENYRDYTKFVKCSKCELLAWCRGCPAVASGKDGNFYAADPQCWKEV